jgi:hypothetical protein
MSDSELSELSQAPVPPDDELEGSLRREVARFQERGEHDQLTLRNIRAASEKKLGLPDDFYKDHAVWKTKSKEVVNDQVVSRCNFERFL